MERRHLHTIKWTQPYATEYQRPYLNNMQRDLEQLIELSLKDGDFTEAREIIASIKDQM
jgi:hypothetical protein